MSSLPDLSRLTPTGGKRSSKREQIVNVFLRQEGHLSADDLVDLIRREDHRISRATVYRTLQWMVDAGIARKVDFGEGRFRFEHSYRQPRHFHLICKSCHRSFEFLSSDIEVLVEEVATARGFTPAKSVVQIYGTCEDCRAGRKATADDAHSDMVFARDALRIAIATERSGLEFYTRAMKVTRDARARVVFEHLAAEEKEHLGKLEARYAELLRRDPQLESRPTFLFFKGAASGIFAEGTEKLLHGNDHLLYGATQIVTNRQTVRKRVPQLVEIGKLGLDLRAGPPGDNCISDLGTLLMNPPRLGRQLGLSDPLQLQLQIA